MWRQNPFPGAADSDQSFSDDEDFDGDASRNCVSLSGCAGKEGGLQILSQLEKLRGATSNYSTEANSAMKCVPSVEKAEGFPILEDEVEIPSFGTEGGFFSSLKRSSRCCSDEEIISDDEDKNVFSKFPNTSNEKNREKELSSLLMKKVPSSLLIKDASNSSSYDVLSEENQSSEASKVKGKPRFSLGCYLQKNEPPSCSTTKNEFLSSIMVSELPQSSKNAESTNVGDSAANDPSDSEEYEQSESPIASHIEVPTHGYSEHSMAELLDGLHERLPQIYREKTTKNGGQRKQPSLKRSITTVEDSEDEPESMDSDSPGEEERNLQNLKVPLPERKRQTLVDCFQEVLDANPWRDEDALAAIPNRSSFGLFGKLQQVMQNEKETELEFMNNLHTSVMPLCGTSCLHVLILSSYLDAKLIVCRCSLEKIPEKCQVRHRPESVSLRRGERTVIFSRRTCSNEDLDVGKIICIYPPWKEVRVEGDAVETILLCTSFSQVSV